MYFILNINIYISLSTACLEFGDTNYQKGEEIDQQCKYSVFIFQIRKSLLLVTLNSMKKKSWLKNKNT